MIGTPPLFVWIAAFTAVAARILMTSGFLFENSDPVYMRRNSDASSADECALFGLCDHFENYPTELAGKLIEELGDRVKHLSMDKLSTSDISYREPSSHKTPLCPFYHKIVHPSEGVNKKGEPQTILNHKPKPVQGFRVEICSPDAKYQSSIVSFDEGWDGTCDQSYVYRNMMIIDKDHNILTTDQIKVPSACICNAFMTNRRQLK